MRIHAEEEIVPSYYTATADRPGPYPRFSGQTRYDVAILGGGYTGLTAALTLAEAGKSVILCEARHVGWGASGRNGGQVHTGLRLGQDALERLAGRSEAHRLWDLALEAKAFLRNLIREHAIACDPAQGLIYAVHKDRLVAGHHRYAEKLRTEYRYEHIDLLDRSAVAERTGSDQFLGGYVDHDASHLHPLKLAFGLARAAARAGAAIFEDSRIESYRQQAGGRVSVRVNGGEIVADHFLLCGDGYLDGIEPRIAAAVLPVNSFILATEPLPEYLRRTVLPANDAAIDSRHLLNYWRKSPDGRLIFGGGENYNGNWPAQINTFLRRSMLSLYPQLAHCKIDFAWGGTLGNTRSRMPLVRRLAPNVWAATGYSGLGVLMAPYLGMTLAKAVGGTLDAFDVFANLPARDFPGGKLLRWPMMVAGLTWYGLMDRL